MADAELMGTIDSPQTKTLGTKKSSASQCILGDVIDGQTKPSTVVLDCILNICNLRSKALFLSSRQVESSQVEFFRGKPNNVGLKIN